MPVKVDLRAANKEASNSRPQRSMDAYKVTMTAETESGWIDTEYLALLTLAVPAAHTGITAKIYGRFKLNNVPQADTETIICDKDGVAKSLNLDQDAEGSTFIIDEAAPFDQVQVVTSGNMTGDLIFGLGA
jgi:hypothetical protein